jgi:hypothetical protein
MTENSTNHKCTASTAPDAAEAQGPAFFLDYDDAECAHWLIACTCLTARWGTTALYHPTVLSRLCAFKDDLFLHTLLCLAVPEKAGLEILFTETVMARLAAVHAKYQAHFLPCAKRLPDFDARVYREELRPYRLRHSAQEGCAQATVKPWTIYSAEELLAMEFPPLQWVVESILPAGLTLFSGRSKDGKSMLVWNICVAVASGGLALGRYGVLQGDVLYLDLEDGGRRAQERLKHVMQGLPAHGPRPASLDIVPMDAALVGQGLEEQLTGWLDQHPNARLIAIDSRFTNSCSLL